MNSIVGVCFSPLVRYRHHHHPPTWNPPLELRFMEASQVLMKVPPSSFQPKNFLPMFPHYTARWLRTTSSSSLTSSSGGGGGGGGNGRTPPPRSPSGPVLLWGLARPLTDVTAAVQYVWGGGGG